MGVTFRAPRSVKECEGMNPHNPKGIPTLGVGILLDPQIFRERLQGQIHWIEAFLISLESSWNIDF